MSFKTLRAVASIAFLASAIWGCGYGGRGGATKEDVKKVQDELPKDFKLEMGGGDTTPPGSGDATKEGTPKSP